MRFILLILLLMVGGCAKAKDASIEERITMEFFGLFVAAETYDKICSNPKILDGDLKKTANINYFGNMQTLAAYTGGLWHIRNPKGSPEEGSQALVKLRENLNQQIEKKLKENGCESEAGQAAAKSLKLFTGYHPAQVFSLIHKKISDAGGKVTSFEEMNKPVSKE